MMLARAVGWIDAHLSRFAFAADASLEWKLASTKALGELAHTADMLARRDDDLREVGERWISHAWKELDGASWILPLLDAAPRLALVASVLPAFHHRGWVESTTVGRLRDAVSRASLDGTELVYAAASFRALGAPLSPEVEERAARRSVLVQCPPPWRLDLLALYQLTHELFYATDWGAHAPDLGAEAHRYARRWIPMWIEIAARSTDADLLAELLSCHEMIGTDTNEVPWDVLARAQIDDGAVKPPSRSVDVRAAVTPTDEFLAHRHTTLVAAMAWAMRDQSMAKRSTA